MENTNEQWQTVPYFDEYEVSENGDVRRCKGSKCNCGTIGGHLKPSIKGRYLGVNLWQDGKRHQLYIHQIVALAFHENRTGLRCVRHIDGNHLNNHKDNLMWGSHTDNMQDMIRHKRTTTGEKNPGARLTEKQVLEIRNRYIKRSADANCYTLAKEYGVNPGIISQICARKRWNHI